MKFAFATSFITYFVLLFAVGAYFKKKNSSASEDLILGNRSLNFWVTALSAQASDMSAWLFMAFPMSVYAGGMPQVWVVLALVFGMYANWQYIAPRLRAQTEALQALTLSTFFERRFKDTSGQLRFITGLIALLYLTYYLAAGMISIGFLFESLFEINYVVGLLVSVSVVVGYTFIGGLVSVAWVDLFQALFLMVAIMIVPILGYFHVGGMTAIEQAAHKAQISLNLFQIDSWREILLPFFGWGLGYFGMPHIITKFMAIKNTKDLVKSKYVGISWQLLTLIGSMGVGLVSIAYFRNGIDNAELIFVELTKHLFHPLTASIVLCGIVAATISTMDSQILTAASFASEDVLPKILKRCNLRFSTTVLFRSAAILIAACSFWIALSRSSTIMDTVYFAWAGLGSSFAPLVIAALYFPKVTNRGALCGVLTGGIVSALWPTINGFLINYDILGPIPSMIPGFGLNCAALWLGSREKA